MFFVFQVDTGMEAHHRGAGVPDSPASFQSRPSRGSRSRRSENSHNCLLPAPEQQTTTSSRSKASRRWRPWQRATMASVLVLLLLYISVVHRNPEIAAYLRSKQESKTTVSKDDIYSCPTTVHKTINAPDKQTKWYDLASQAILAGNISEYRKVFRHAEFDNWGHSYEVIKAGMTEWKRQQYVKELSLSSDEPFRIYESASGLGLNLYMTLEILEQELGDLPNIVVYGNEYVDESVQIFHKLFPQQNDASNSPWPGKARTGTVCTADSTDLSFVPSDSMDFVYTGYITPLMNPLHLGGNSTDDHFARLTELCESDADDRESQKLKRLAIQRQEDWYASWVTEMTRIAKPGAPVIVEQVSYPYCEAYFDWDGVAPDFWTDRGIRRYKWDIDPDSIVMDNDKIFRRRYHVFMRKN